MQLIKTALFLFAGFVSLTYSAHTHHGAQCRTNEECDQTEGKHSCFNGFCALVNDNSSADALATLDPSNQKFPMDRDDDKFGKLLFCSVNEDCARGYLCDGGLCAVDPTYQGLFSDDPNNQMIPMDRDPDFSFGLCVFDSDCSRGYVCSSGLCTVEFLNALDEGIVGGKPCARDSQCTGGQKCDLKKKECKLPDDPTLSIDESIVGGKDCVRDGQCSGGQKCIKKQCQLPDDPTLIGFLKE
ncbi:hypothetical protein FGO68_gene7906 [Halteria grandinella]|uniref:Dickkopf N-terminal cysteine-rich domain-containing protein n=1 Tax=Halteria grandinella TaxID=5974 RepID=A0A8J8NJX3_HALGN|nr:hypothetical protein FGO68_gene7906 [Halteria grandinella]